MALPLFISSGLILSLVGCDQDKGAMEEDELVDKLDPALETTDKNDQLNKLGYVRYTKDELKEDEKTSRELTMNREEVADIITRLILRNDHFKEVATLVTDEEVLIAYQKEEEQDSKYTADIAKQSAMSIIPAYYEVYVSDNERLMDSIHSLKNSTTKNKNYDNTVNSIIEEMKKSPQGVDKKMND